MNIEGIEKEEGKVCTKCGVWKPLEEYYKHKGGKDGRNFDTIVYKMLDMLHLELDAEMEAWKEKVKNFERGEIPEKDNLPF